MSESVSGWVRTAHRPGAAGHSIIPSRGMALGVGGAGKSLGLYCQFENAVLAKQNGLILWLMGLHSMLSCSRAQRSSGFAGGLRVVLCPCSRAEMRSRSVCFTGTSGTCKNSAGGL